MTEYHYTIKEYSKTIPAQHYITHFRDADKFLEFCKQCKNYGNCWACPPFEQDWSAILERYDTVTLFACQMTFAQQGIPLSESTAIIRPERQQIEKMLRQQEQERCGKAFAYAGTCLYCPEGTCTRAQGISCRHPELVRPSLEAVGFDIGKTTSELFGIELKWTKDNTIPEYLVLVSGLFYNMNS